MVYLRCIASIELSYDVFYLRLVEGIIEKV